VNGGPFFFVAPRRPAAGFRAGRQAEEDRTAYDEFLARFDRQMCEAMGSRPSEIDTYSRINTVMRGFFAVFADRFPVAVRKGLLSALGLVIFVL
jgi:hypothetical protein